MRRYLPALFAALLISGAEAVATTLQGGSMPGVGGPALTLSGCTNSPAGNPACPSFQGNIDAGVVNVGNQINVGIDTHITDNQINLDGGKLSISLGLSTGSSGIVADCTASGTCILSNGGSYAGPGGPPAGIADIYGCQTDGLFPCYVSGVGGAGDTEHFLGVSTPSNGWLPSIVLATPNTSNNAGVIEWFSPTAIPADPQITGQTPSATLGVAGGDAGYLTVPGPFWAGGLTIPTPDAGSVQIGTNYALSSQVWSNSTYWEIYNHISGVNTTGECSDNATTAPNGTTTAASCVIAGYVATTADYSIVQNNILIAPGTSVLNPAGSPINNVFSIWLASPTTAQVTLQLYDNTQGVSVFTGNLALTTTWQQFSVYKLPAGNSHTYIVDIGQQSGQGAGVHSTGGTIYVWGAEFTTDITGLSGGAGGAGGTPQPYVVTTTAAKVNQPSTYHPGVNPSVVNLTAGGAATMGGSLGADPTTDGKIHLFGNLYWDGYVLREYNTDNVGLDIMEDPTNGVIQIGKAPAGTNGVTPVYTTLAGPVTYIEGGVGAEGVVTTGTVVVAAIPAPSAVASTAQAGEVRVGVAGIGTGSFTVQLYDSTASANLCTTGAITCTNAANTATSVTCSTAQSVALADTMQVRVAITGTCAAPAFSSQWWFR